MRWGIALGAIILMAGIGVAVKAKPIEDQGPFGPNYVPSGEVLYRQFCANCHGLDAKGDGPMAAALKVHPADLTQLSKKNMGKFPRDYVERTLRFGPGPAAHGSSDMPAWGPIFQFFDKNNERAVQRRIKNLCDYLESVQVK